MKAKDKKTGEIVDVYHEPQHGQRGLVYKEAVFVNGRMWSEDELEFIDTPKAEDTIDWEQRRYEIAKEMMPQVFRELTRALQTGLKVDVAGMTAMEATAERAVWYADALIAELKKEKLQRRNEEED